MDGGAGQLVSGERGSVGTWAGQELWRSSTSVVASLLSLHPPPPRHTPLLFVEHIQTCDLHVQCMCLNLQGGHEDSPCLISLNFWGGGWGLVEDREWNQSEYLASAFSSFGLATSHFSLKRGFRADL